MKRVFVLLLFAIIFFVFAPFQKATAEEIRRGAGWEINPAYLNKHRLSDLHKLIPPVNRRKKVLCVVVDSGVQTAHPVFAGHLRSDLNSDWVDGRPDIDSGPHGTLVASIMLAASGGTCDIVSLKAIYMVNGNWGGSEEAIAAAFRMVNTWNAKEIAGYAGIVINASLYTGPSETIRTEIGKLGARAAVVGIAGNQGINPVQYPGHWALDFPWMTSVGAIDATGKKTSFSNWGARMLNTALGVDVAGAVPFDFNGHGLGTGTSFSAPIVSGQVAALMALAADKGWVLPPALLARIANIGDYNPQLAGMMADPPTTANGIKAWEALNKLLNLKPLRADLNRSGEVPITSISVQEPLDEFRGLKFSAQIEMGQEKKSETIRDCWLSGTTINFVGPSQPGDYRMAILAEGHELFSAPLTVPGPRTADDDPPRPNRGQGGGHGR